MVCKNCNHELDEGSLFCTNCGASTQGAASVADPETPQLREINDEKIKEYFNDVKRILFNMIVAPISTIQFAARSPLKESSFILAGLVAILYGLMNIWIISRAYNEVMSLLGSFLGYFFSYGSDPNYGTLFAYSVLLYLLALGGIFGGVYIIGHYLCKGKGTPYSAWNVAVVSSIPFIASLPLTVIFSYISASLSIMFILAGVTVFTLSLYHGIKSSMELSHDTVAYTTPLVIIVLYIVIYLAVKVII